MKKIIKLVSSQNKVFEVLPEIIKCSGLISLFLEQSENDDNVEGDHGNKEEDEPLPLPKVSSYVLEMLINWAKCKYEELQSLNNGGDNTKGLTQWKTNFMKEDKGIQAELVAAADYLDIPELCSFGRQVLANEATDDIDI